jgi:hypothetical protein
MHYQSINQTQSMKNSGTQDERFAKMSFATVYPLYLAKVEKKGRTEEELYQVIQWLTGLNKKQLQALIKGNLRDTFSMCFTQSQCETYHRGYLWLSCGRNRESFNAAGSVFR